MMLRCTRDALHTHILQRRITLSLDYEILVESTSLWQDFDSGTYIQSEYRRLMIRPTHKHVGPGPLRS